MKKIMAIAIVAVMFAALFAPSVSAGDLLFTDDFNDSEFNELDWIVEGISLFYIEQGGPTHSPHVEGWKEAVVQQTTYGENAPAPRVYGANVAFKCDTWIYDDGGSGSTEHWVGLWWADYMNEAEGVSDAKNRITYMLQLNYERRQVILIADGVGVGEEYFAEATEVSVWDMPDSMEFEMDPSEPTVFNLGMRINGTQIDGFLNDEKVVSFTAPRMGSVKSPLIFWNCDCWTGFDNWMVSTADYDLFGEGAAPAVNPVDEEPSGGDGANEPAPTEMVVETKVETKVVEDTDENGEIVTRIETEIVTEQVARPAADTGNGGGGNSGGGSARTGDMAVVVAAVMIIAVGSAIVVRKASSK